MKFVIKHFKELSITELYRGQGTAAEQIALLFFDEGITCHFKLSEMILQK